MTHTAKDRFLPITAVMERTAISRSHIYTLIRRGDFPPAIKLGAKCSRWSEAAIEQWMEAQLG